MKCVIKYIYFYQYPISSKQIVIKLWRYTLWKIALSEELQKST